jgi:hypothetical protein
VRSEPVAGICGVCRKPAMVTKMCHVCGRWIGDCCRFNVAKRAAAALRARREVRVTH